MIDWNDLAPEHLNILDSPISERELADAHNEAANAILRGLAATLNQSPIVIASISEKRQEFLNTNPYGRAVVDKSVDEVAWLEARRQGVTATEVSKLAQGQPAQRRNILEEKLTGERSFLGNKYTDFGLEREPFIAAQLEAEFGFKASDVLFHAEEDVRHLATPDGVLLNADGTIFIAEIKTGSKDLHPDGEAFRKSTYMDQMQWQMYVIGSNCKRCLFAWEQHDNVWVLGEDGRERPTPLPLKWVWVERDEPRIDYLIGLADEFLADMDWNAA